jgi:hypothetical protein
MIEKVPGTRTASTAYRKPSRLQTDNRPQRLGWGYGREPDEAPKIPADEAPEGQGRTDLLTYIGAIVGGLMLFLVFLRIVGELVGWLLLT